MPAPQGFCLGRSGFERTVLMSCLLLVLAAEWLNPAVAVLIDRYDSEYQELAGLAKDMDSAARFALILNVLAT